MMHHSNHIEILHKKRDGERCSIHQILSSNQGEAHMVRTTSWHWCSKQERRFLMVEDIGVFLQDPQTSLHCRGCGSIQVVGRCLRFWCCSQTQVGIWKRLVNPHKMDYRRLVYFGTSRLVEEALYTCQFGLESSSSSVERFVVGGETSFAMRKHKQIKSTFNSDWLLVLEEGYGGEAIIGRKIEHQLLWFSFDTDWYNIKT